MEEVFVRARHLKIGFNVHNERTYEHGGNAKLWNCTWQF